MDIRPLVGIPAIDAGDDLGALIVEAANPSSGEIVVCSQKIVSKAEGRVRRLDQVEPGEDAIELAGRVGRDPRLVELILTETRQILRAAEGRLIVETHSGWICANAGIDASNLTDSGTVSLLPEDADVSARRIRSEIAAVSGERPAVVIADSFGRAWRVGQAEVAIGCAGVGPVDDWEGRADASGRPLAATLVAQVDHLAGAADLVRDKDSNVPGAVIAGLGHLVTAEDGPGARAIQRPESEDLFR